MRLWWIANIYWLTCITYFSYQLHVFDFDFDTSVLGEGPSRALIAIVMICASLMIIEFQSAWFMYLKCKKGEQVPKHKK